MCVCVGVDARVGEREREEEGMEVDVGKASVRKERTTLTCDNNAWILFTDS